MSFLPNRDTFYDWTQRMTCVTIGIVKTMGAAKFKEQCLSVLSSLDAEGIVITKHGKPVARLVPVETESASLIGKFKGRIRIRGKILSTGLRWDAES